MARAIADRIAGLLLRALARTGRASIALSGGSTPADVYRRLSRKHIYWADIQGILVDERWVPPGDRASNESFIAETLQQNEARQLNVTGLWSEAATLREAADVATERLAAIGSPFNVVILGMGIDGHTASWFPHSEGLDEAIECEKRVCAIRAIKSGVTGDYVDRLTLSLGAIADAEQICLMIAGNEKRATYEAAATDGPVEEMPVRAILRARPDIHVFWAP